MSMGNNKKKLFCYICVTVCLVMIGLAAVYRLWNINLAEIPLAICDDGISELTRQKMITEGQKMNYTSERLGAPFSYGTKDFASPSLLPELWMNFWALLTDNYVLSFNLGYLSAFILIAVISLIILLKIGIRSEIAIVSAVLYSFLPYHILRGQVHLSLSFYVVIPIIVYYILELMGSSLYNRNRSSIAMWLISMLLVGMGGIYYAFFSCFFLCVAILYNVLNRVSWKEIAGCVFSIGLICMGVFICMIPNLLYWLENGINENAVIRYPYEVTIYALRLAQLILPVTDHRIPILAKIKGAYNQVITVTENDWATLGLFFTIGLSILLIYVFQTKGREKNSILMKLSVLAYCGLAYATIGGFIEIQAVVFTMIRCSNRISVFIAFFSCIAVSLMFQEVFKKIEGKKIYTVVLMLILCVGIYDQTPASQAECYSTIYDSDTKAFIQEIESISPNGMILQLPNVLFPENGKRNQMDDYSHFVGYLYSDTLRWSYGAYKGREGSTLLNNLCSLPIDEMIRQSAEVGYDGIYIDRYGYTNDEVQELENSIYQITKQVPIVSENNRYSYFSLEQYILDNNIGYNENTLMKNLVGFTNGANMYAQETDGVDKWCWGQKDSSLKITNYSDQELTVRLSFDLNFYADQLGCVAVEGNNIQDTIDVQQSRCHYEKVIKLNKGDNYISFKANLDNVSVESGKRQVCFRILNCKTSVEFD